MSFLSIPVPISFKILHDINGKRYIDMMLKSTIRMVDMCMVDMVASNFGRIKKAILYFSFSAIRFTTLNYSILIIP